MGTAIDLTGQRFGMWTAVRIAPSHNGKTMWTCRCECGTEREIRSTAIRSGQSQSCGCMTGRGNVRTLQPATTETITRRLLARRHVTASGCWEWTGQLDEHGAGRISVNGIRTRQVPRFAAWIWFGFDINSSAPVAHRCGNLACFNPEHLFIGKPGQIGHPQRDITSEDGKRELINVLLSHRSVAPNGCWHWTGSRDTKGYGFTAFRCAKNAFRKKPTARVHRIAAWLWLGFDIDSRSVVCHHCDTPPCFNPEHLFVGTQSDNIIDSVVKGRFAVMHPNAGAHERAKTHCPQGHEYTPENTYHEKGDSGSMQRRCKQCRRDQHQRWRSANREHIRAKARANYRKTKGA